MEKEFEEVLITFAIRVPNAGRFSFNKFSYATEGTGKHMVCFSVGGKNAFSGTQKRNVNTMRTHYRLPA